MKLILKFLGGLCFLILTSTLSKAQIKIIESDYETAYSGKVAFYYI